MNMVSLPEFWLRQPRHIRDAVLRKLLDRQLGAGEVPPSALVKADRSRPVPASLEQEFILSRRDKTGMDLAWTMAAPPVIFDKVDIARVQHAIDSLVRRHPVLAARFEKTGAGWQMRLPAEPAAPVAVVKVPLTAAVTGAEAWVRRRYQALLAEPFDAVAGPLFRAELCTFAGRGVLLLSYCSLVADGESVYLLDRDLRALLDGAGPVSLPAPAFDYADYAATQAVERQAGHFDAALAAIAARLESGPPQAWADGRPPAGPSRLYEQVIGVAAGERLDRWAAANRTTGPAVLLSAFARLLHGLDGEDDLWIGSATALRDRPETAAMVGTFARQNLLRFAWPGEADLIRTAGSALAESLDQQALPHKLVLDHLERARPGAPNAFRYVFNHRFVPGGETGEAVDIAFAPGPDAATALREEDILFMVMQDGPVRRLHWYLRADRFDPGQAEALLRGFDRDLRGLIGA